MIKTMEEVFAPQIDPTTSDTMTITAYIEGRIERIAIDKREKDAELWKALNEEFYFDGYSDSLPVLKLNNPRLLSIFR